MKLLFIGLIIASASQLAWADEPPTPNQPHHTQFIPKVHEQLPKAMLDRIKVITDTFEVVDGISYEKAVDLYQRDTNPESNLVIWEEMARVYREFCASRCTAPEEQIEVYRALLLRTFFTEAEALERLYPEVLTAEEAKEIISSYQLQAQPVGAAQ